MDAPPSPNLAPSPRRLGPTVVGPIANVDEAQMLQKALLLCELRSRLSPPARRR